MDDPEVVHDVSRQLSGMSRDMTRWARQGSNLRPEDYESPALTTELRARVEAQPTTLVGAAPGEGFEPSALGLTIPCSTY
jgi:hypothetical protein